MAESTAFRKQKKTLLKLKSNPFTALFAAMAGAALMVPVAATVMTISVKSEMSGQLASLNNRLVQMQKADLNTVGSAGVCTGAPSAQTGQVLGAQVQAAGVTSSLPSGGRGSGVPSSPSTTTIVKKIVTGSLVATATNENTGPNSTNKIDISNKTTTTVTNNNDVDLNNFNHQDSSSGDATVSGNTTGGDATSGNATNTNNTDLSILFKN